MKESRWSKARTVEEYLAEVPPKDRAALNDLRKVIRSVAPKAEEGISYQMPVFKQDGALVFYASFKDHLSLFVANKAIMKDFESELKNFPHSAGTIHFTAEKRLPDALVKTLVKAKLKANHERAMKRKRK